MTEKLNETNYPESPIWNEFTKGNKKEKLTAEVKPVMTITPRNMEKKDGIITINLPYDKRTRIDLKEGDIHGDIIVMPYTNGPTEIAVLFIPGESGIKVVGYRGKKQVGTQYNLPFSTDKGEFMKQFTIALDGIIKGRKSMPDKAESVYAFLQMIDQNQAPVLQVAKK